MQNTQVILARRPVGVPQPEHFDITRTPVPDPAEGEVLIRITHWSVDPAQRGWANNVPNYSPPVALGDPMRAFAVGDVLASRHAGYAEGDVVEGLFGWQTHACLSGDAIARKVTETDLPRSYALGILGLNGTTAYFGLRETCAARAGDTVVVSTAAGAVGSAVGQIARLMGCRTVGIAGGPEKTALCTQAFGYDAAIDYKAQDVGAALADACPDGVDCYFDNTCGPISDAVMGHLAQGARITICGTAAITEWDPIPSGPPGASATAGRPRPDAGVPDLRLPRQAGRGARSAGGLAPRRADHHPRAYPQRPRGRARRHLHALSRREYRQAADRGVNFHHGS